MYPHKQQVDKVTMDIKQHILSSFNNNFCNITEQKLFVNANGIHHYNMINLRGTRK